MPKQKLAPTKHEGVFTYDTKDGIKHYVRIKYKDYHTGAWKEKTASGLVNLTAAKRKKVELQELVNKERTNIFEHDNLTFGEWREMYYNIMSPTWAKTTQNSVANIHNNHLAYFDDYVLSQISKIKYQEFINFKLHTADLSFKTVRDIHTKMMAIMNYAVDDELLTRNKLTKVKIEKKEIEKKKHLEVDELVILDVAAREIFCPLKYACYVLMRMGLRKSEALGIKRKSVKMNSHNVVDVIIDNAKSIHEDATVLKSAKSYRTITLRGGNAHAVLKALDTAAFIHNEHKVHFGEDSRIIISKHSCRTYNYTMPTHMTDALTAHTGIKVTPHMLRHSFATHSLASGNNVISVAQWLGHSPEMSQRIYAHNSKSSHSRLIDFANAK